MKISLILVLMLDFWYCSAEFVNNATYRRKRSLGFKTVCYQNLGCFYGGPPYFNLPFRPIIKPPLPPEVIGTLFLLFTRKNKNNPFSFSPLTLGSLHQSYFDPHTWTRIIIHGYVEGTYYNSWHLEMKDVILQTADENVIIVDHSTTNQLPRLNYVRTANDVRVVGAQVAQLINFLSETFGADIRKFHLIGQSTGAHAAGYAGERLPNLGRISGMDPAGPLYRFSGRAVNVDTIDATLVDVIHADPALSVIHGYGTTEDLGHANFWPNGGRQTGLISSSLRSLFKGVLVSEVIRTLLFYRHVRAAELFLFSFNQNNCLFVGVECSSWNEFLQGKCDCGVKGEKCSIMGFYSMPRRLPNVRYYLKVGSERPYCLHQYQVTVFIKINAKIAKSVQAVLQINLFGQNHIQDKLNLNVDLTVKYQTNTFLVTSTHHLDAIKEAEVSFLNTTFNSTLFALPFIKVNYLFPVSKEQTESYLCPSTISDHKMQRIILFSSKECFWQ